MFGAATDSPTFSIFTIKKKRNPFVVKVNQFTTKFKSVFDSHYQMHIRRTHNRSRRFHISVLVAVQRQRVLYTETIEFASPAIVSAHFHVSWLSDFIFYHKPYINRFTNHFSIHIYFIIVNPITMDSIIFVGIDFRKLKKNGKFWILNFVVCGILPETLLETCECKITTNEVFFLEF
jgi:hypothetical protein